MLNRLSLKKDRTDRRVHTKPMLYSYWYGLQVQKLTSEAYSQALLI